MNVHCWIIEDCFLLYNIPNHCLYMCSLAALSFGIFWRVACYLLDIKYQRSCYIDDIIISNKSSHFIVVVTCFYFKRTSSTIDNSCYCFSLDFISAHDQLLLMMTKEKHFVLDYFFLLSFGNFVGIKGNYEKMFDIILQKSIYIILLWHKYRDKRTEGALIDLLLQKRKVIQRKRGD